jgi:hypothetical protein
VRRHVQISINQPALLKEKEGYDTETVSLLLDK